MRHTEAKGLKPRHVPEALRYPTKETDMLRVRVRMFWIMRYMVLNLTQNSAQLHNVLRRNPLLSEQRPVEFWEAGQVTTIGLQKFELIHCNVRIDNKM